MAVEVTMETALSSRNGRRRSRRVPAQSATQQLSIEFQKCQARYEALHLDRAATTMGLGLDTADINRRLPVLSSRRRRPLTETSVSRDLAQRTPRVKTAPGLLIASTETGIKGGDPLEVKDSQGERSPRDDTGAVRITPEVLIQLLAARGLGTPCWYRYPPPPPETATAKHYSSFRKITYYMEKIKGRSRIDCDIANAKTTAFCEEQREIMRAQRRSPSALFRSRFPGVNKPADMYGDGRSVVASRTDVNTLADTTTMTDGSGNKQRIVFRRIKTWIEDCETAISQDRGPPVQTQGVTTKGK